jgi:hypothetical protein
MFMFMIFLNFGQILSLDITLFSIKYFIAESSSLKISIRSKNNMGKQVKNLFKTSKKVNFSAKLA